MKKFFEIKPDFFVRLDSIKKVEVVNGCIVVIHYSDDRKDEVHCANTKQKQFLKNLFSALEECPTDIISTVETKDPLWYKDNINKMVYDLKYDYPDCATRIHHICIAKSITTLGDLVKFGKNNFRVLRGVGGKM